MVKIIDVMNLLKYHYNDDNVELIQLTDRDGNDIQIWQDVPKGHRGLRPIIPDYEIEFDTLLTFIANDMYEDEQLDDLILSNMTLLMREIRLKNILES